MHTKKERKVKGKRTRKKAEGERKEEGQGKEAVICFLCAGRVFSTATR